jgi:GAF domain-containing protein
MNPVETGREHLITRAFVSLADTLVDEYDVIALLDRLVGYSVELLAADAAGIVLADARGRLRAVAASSEDAQLMELLQLQSDQGPCLDCVRSGSPVNVIDLTVPAAAGRWPVFAAAVADSAAFRSVHALPLRLRGEAIGALNLFHRHPGPLPLSIFPWDRLWPTWRRSGSCPNAPSDTARSSTNNFRPRCTAG